MEEDWVRRVWMKGQWKSLEAGSGWVLGIVQAW